MSIHDVDRDWLASVRSGLVVVRNGRSGTDSIRRIARTTPTQIVLEDGSKYRRADGDQVGAGDRYFSNRIRQGTNEELQAIAAEAKRVRYAKSLAHRNWLNLPLSVLEQVNAVLESHKQKEDEG